MQQLWKAVWRFLKKLEVELTYDPAVPLLGIYPKELIIEKRHMDPNIHCSSMYND